MSSLWKMCCGCCDNDESEDQQALIRPVNPEPDPVDSFRSNPEIIGIPRTPPPVNSAPKTREQLEEDMVTRIIDKASERLIDVSPYEYPFGSDVDVAERSQKYQTMISKHDESKCDPLPVSLLLENVGLDLPEVLQRPPLDDEDINVLRTWNKACLASCRVGLQIEKRDDLVVHMNTEE